MLAHVPDIGDFVGGLKEALKPEGVITVEFPHVLNLIRYHQFDTIYHEHFSYLSVLAVKRIFEEQGLKLFDIEKLNTHGGSLRVYAIHAENQGQQVSRQSAFFSKLLANSVPKNAILVSIPFSIAASATLLEGSIPRGSIPYSLKYCNRYPSLEATSITTDDAFKESFSTIMST